MTRESAVHIVEDDDAVRDSLTLLLEIEGYRVEAYASAEAFLRASPKTGCIVTDMQMPGLGGLGLLEELRRSGDARPVIMITGRVSKGLAAQASALGVFRVIAKPFIAEVILEAIRGAIGPR